MARVRSGARGLVIVTLVSMHDICGRIVIVLLLIFYNVRMSCILNVFLKKTLILGHRNNFNQIVFMVAS